MISKEILEEKSRLAVADVAFWNTEATSALQSLIRAQAAFDAAGGLLPKNAALAGALSKASEHFQRIERARSWMESHAMNLRTMLEYH